MFDVNETIAASRMDSCASSSSGAHTTACNNSTPSDRVDCCSVPSTTNLVLMISIPRITDPRSVPDRVLRLCESPALPERVSTPTVTPEHSHSFAVSGASASQTGSAPHRRAVCRTMNDNASSTLTHQGRPRNANKTIRSQSIRLSRSRGLHWATATAMRPESMNSSFIPPLSGGTATALSIAAAFVAVAAPNTIEYAIGLQTLALLGVMCDPVESSARGALIPFSIGPTPWGGIVGLMILVLAVFTATLLVAVAFLKMNRRKAAALDVPWWYAPCGKARCPALALSAAQLSVEGIAFIVTSTFTSGSIGAGITALVYGCTIIAFFVYANTVVCRRRSYVVMPSSNASWPWWLRWAAPHGGWQPSAMASAFSPVFAPYRQGRESAAVGVSLARAVLIGALGGADSVDCTVRQWILAVVTLTHSIAVVAMGAHRVATLNAPLASGSLAVSAAFAVAATAGTTANATQQVVLGGIVLHVAGATLTVTITLIHHFAQRWKPEGRSSDSANSEVLLIPVQAISASSQPVVNPLLPKIPQPP